VLEINLEKLRPKSIIEFMNEKAKAIPEEFLFFDFIIFHIPGKTL